MSLEAAFVQADALGQLRSLLRGRQVFDELLAEAVRAACATGVARSTVAEVLGVHRATLYRQFLPAVSDADREDATIRALSREDASLTGATRPRSTIANAAAVVECGS